MSEKVLSVAKYLEKRTFNIPDYQRGYKWGVNEKDKTCSVTVFMNSLIDAKNRKDKEYFIEAVTVSEENGKVILIDGQQRTTTLYLMFIALGYFDELKDVRIQYDIREDSDKFLRNLYENKGVVTEDFDVQDVFYFKKAINTIQTVFEESRIEKSCFKEFVLENVKLLYNVVPKDKAITTFTAMNGLKAVMLPEELIKSELLIKSSRTKFDGLSNEEVNDLEWKVNEEHARKAKSWDRWQYWWNSKDVKDYIGISDKQHPLHYLLRTYWNINNTSSLKFSFETFKSNFLIDFKQAKETFEGLRKLQKSFEDFYDDYHRYNYMGIILKTKHGDEKEKALHHYIGKNNTSGIEEYAHFSIVGTKHDEIINNTSQKQDDGTVTLIKQSNANDTIEALKDNNIYGGESQGIAEKILLLLNIKMDDKLNRKFDFAVWNNKSLEHIHPQSKAKSLKFNEQNDGSVHCIGNLLLIYGNNNSTLSNYDFEEKKAIVFDVDREFKSKNLLHSLSIFAASSWGEKEIAENKIKIINQLKKIYGIK